MARILGLQDEGGQCKIALHLTGLGINHASIGLLLGLRRRGQAPLRAFSRPRPASAHFP